MEAYWRVNNPSPGLLVTMGHKELEEWKEAYKKDEGLRNIWAESPLAEDWTP